MPVDRSLDNVVSDRIKKAAQTVAPVLSRMGLNTAALNLVFHQDTGHPFLLLQDSDGAIVVASPETDAGDTWLHQQVPDAQPFEQRGVAEWATKQQWVSLASVEVHATADAADDTTRALDDLDAQWQLFRDLLDDAYKGARLAVQDLPEATAHRLSLGLHHVSWTNGDQFEIGIRVGYDEFGTYGNGH